MKYTHILAGFIIHNAWGTAAGQSPPCPHIPPTTPSAPPTAPPRVTTRMAGALLLAVCLLKRFLIIKAN